MDHTAFARRLLEPVPVHRTFGLVVRWSGDARSEVALETTPPLTNVIGSLHASGLVTLVDAAGLAAIVGACTDEAEFDGVVPLGAVASLRFLAPARGVLVGTCALDDDAGAAVRSVLARTTDRARFDTHAQVHDDAGRLVCEGTFGWAMRATTPG